MELALVLQDWCIGRPELMFADPQFYRTADEAREAGRVAVATAMADYTVSGPVAA